MYQMHDSIHSKVNTTENAFVLLQRLFHDFVKYTLRPCNLLCMRYINAINMTIMFAGLSRVCLETVVVKYVPHTCRKTNEMLNTEKRREICQKIYNYKI